MDTPDNKKGLTLLVLDELNQADGRVVGDTVYMLGNGLGKARANERGGSAGSQHRWRLAYVSSGEGTLDKKMAEDGRKVKAGQEVRVISALLQENRPAPQLLPCSR